MTGDIAQAAKFIGASVVMLGAFGPGLAIGILAAAAMIGISRNPDTAPVIQTNMILAIAFAEAIAIYALVVALIIIFVG